MKRLKVFVMILPICVVIFPEKGCAQFQAKFSYDALLNCEKPNVRNYPVHGEGTGQLSTDRNGSVEIRSSMSGRQTYNAKLGGKPSEAREGSASLSVLGRRSLRVVRDYPNNTAVVDLRIVGTACTLKVENRLKPGKRQFTFTTPLGLAYCGKPQIIKTSCAAI